MTRLSDFFKDTSIELMDGYRKSSKVKHTSSKGRVREIFIKRFLEKLYPSKFEIGQECEIIDSTQYVSDEADIVICDKTLPIFDYEGTKLFLSAGVFAHIEVKSDLATTLTNALDKSASIKKLKRDVDISMSSGKIKKTYFKRKTIFSCIFAYEGPTKETFKKNIFEYYKKDKEIDNWVDLICVLNKYIMHKNYNTMKLEFLETENNSLLCFFFLLNDIIYSNWRNIIDLAKYFEKEELSYKNF